MLSILYKRYTGITVPQFRKDIESIGVYVPGKPIDDVMREFGLTDIVKLASNECPEEPFTAVQEAVAAAAAYSHRYPDTMAFDLSGALAELHSIDRDNLLVGPGSSQILMSTAHAVGGPGTSAVFADNSFLLYSIITKMSRGQAIVVPLDDELRHDVDALIRAVREDTTVLYVCNPNNPTGTYIAPEEIDRIVAEVSSDVLVVVDEAYEEYVSAPGHRSSIVMSFSKPIMLLDAMYKAKSRTGAALSPRASAKSVAGTVTKLNSGTASTLAGTARNAMR